MANKDKTREQLTKELAGARRRLAQLEVLEDERKVSQETLRQSEEKYQGLVGNIRLGIFRSTPGPSGRFLEVNRAVGEITGYSREELLQMNVADLYLHPEEREAVLKEIVSAQGKITKELNFRKKDGTEIVVSDTKTPVRDDSGKVLYLDGVLEDITERKRAEAALLESEERYRTLVDSALVGVYRSNLKGDILYVNKAWVSMLGFDSIEETIASGALARYKNPGDRAILIKELTEKGKVSSLELELLTKTGEVKNVIINAVLEGDTLSGMLIDITERKVTGAALRLSEERCHTALDSLMEGCQIIGFDWRYLYVNDSVAKQGRRPKEELLGHTMMEMYPGIENTEMFSHLRRCMGKRIPHHMENLFTYPDGSQDWFELSISPVPEGIFILSLDISEHKQAEANIEQAAKEWQTTFDSISDWVSIHDRDYRIIRANKAFAEALKMKPEEIIGRHCYEMIHGEKEAGQYCAHKVALETGKPTYREFFNPHLGIFMEVLCSPVFNDKGEITSTIHISRDVTERKKRDEQLMLTDRLASIGQLASGIAHELNNPLTGVIGFSELLLEKDIPEDVREDLTTINREARRTASVVKGLLTFARKQKTEKEAVDINRIIEEVLQLRSYEYKVSNIEVRTWFAADLPQITGNSAQLQQVFINLIVNAEQAMLEAHGRGALTITTERAGDTEKISFADDGPGIAPENMRRLFTPFFTTKEVGKGTGLGLSICHGIIAEHSGRIYAESEPGKGANFIVELPIGKTIEQAG